jgi:formyltetrahydrofolate deformylase
MNKYCVLIDTQDAQGLVYKISSVFFHNYLNIVSTSEFVDKESNRFFMRSVVVGSVEREVLYEALLAALPERVNVEVIVPNKKRIVLMATKESHALGDILMRYEAGELNAEILGVVSNYDNLRGLVERFGIEYHCVSHENRSREEHEEKVLECLDDYKDIDYIVLAKYMRILTPDFISRYENKIINIHHSFLPAFIGANPYKQAYERGVKIIGATAHFVNNNLDEGPIIAQDVKHIDHALDWKDMQRVGKDIEKIVLSRALKLAIEDKIFVNANKTVIFDV